MQIEAINFSLFCLCYFIHVAIKKNEPSLPISKSFVNASGNMVHRVPVLQAVPVLASSNFSYQPTIFLYSEPSRDLSAQR